MKVASISVFATLAAEALPSRRPAPAPVQPAERVRSATGFGDTVAAALPEVAPTDGVDDAERTEAVIRFAQALWQAAHGGARSGRADGEGHDHGRRAHGWNRNPNGYAGLVPQIEQLIARYAAAAGAPAVPPAPAADPAPSTDPAPAADPVAPVPAPSAGRAVPAPAPAAGPVAPGADAAEDASGPPDDPDAPEPGKLPVPDPLMASFRAMLDAFHAPADAAGGASALADFLTRLVDALRGAPSGGASACGSFVSVRA